MDKPSTSKVCEEAEAAGEASQRDDAHPYRHLNSTQLLPDKAKDVIVQVSAAASPGRFYIILPFGGKTVEDLDVAPIAGNRAVILNAKAEAVINSIHNYYSNLPYHIEVCDLVIGSIVAAKHNEKWYRGKVVEVLESFDLAKIFLVDIGGEALVHRSVIRPICENFLKAPFQAIPCSLLGVQPSGAIGSGWSSSAIEYFTNFANDQVLLAETIQRDGDIFQVSLRRMLDDDQRDLARELIKMGYAQYKSKKVKSQKKKK